MSAYSTIYITREDALAEILKKIPILTDDQMEELAEKLEIAGCLHNFSIVNEYFHFNDHANFRPSGDNND